MDIIEQTSADTLGIGKAFALSAVSTAIGTYVTANYLAGRFSTQLCADKHFMKAGVAVLGPSILKLLALKGGYVKGDLKNIVQNSIVIDLAAFYGIYMLPKIASYVSAPDVFSLPRGESFSSGVGGSLASLQNQLRQVEGKAEQVIAPAIARAAAARTGQLIG